MEDTIAAIATAYGEGGIGIVRISGPKARDILASVFVPFSENCREGQAQARKMLFGHAYDAEKNLLDEVLAVFMKGPKTYTGEDVAEIQCHGSVLALRRVLDACLAAGARMAEPGEFTKRAFLNGRLDLSQAESVIDLIEAKSNKGYEAALSQLAGSVSGEVRAIREKLMDQLVLLAVNMDYPDEDIELATLDKLREALLPIRADVDALYQTAETGKLYREGISCAICGKPNVGKSSLLNALLREERAIVTNIPGTTRDTIEESMTWEGFRLKLTDTAGIRTTTDPIEQIGIQKSKDALESADLVFFLVDGSSPLTEEDRELANTLDASKTLLLRTKSDCESVLSENEVSELLPGAEMLSISAKTGDGVGRLLDALKGRVLTGKVTQKNSAVITSLRQKDDIRRALASLDSALSAIDRKEAIDLIEVDVREAWEALGEIIGETATEDIITRVFERFCLGK